MGQHAQHKGSSPRVTLALLGAAAVGAGLLGVLILIRPGTGQTESADLPPRASPCATTLRVVTASSFAPALREVGQSLEAGSDCVDLVIIVQDGRSAGRTLPSVSADVWIPDDTAWTAVGLATELAEPEAAGSGTILATSPIYLVTDAATADQVEGAGAGWHGLADLVTGDSGVRLVVSDPASSGDGLLGVGAVGEAVWLADGMDASAEALATALPETRTVSGHALPAETGEVGLVAEYALLPLLTGGTGAESESAAAAQAATILAPTDNTALLRYTWLPTAAAAADPGLAEPMARLLEALTGEAADAPLSAAGLRRADGTVPTGTTNPLPEIAAAPFEVLGGHQVDHVFATWYAGDRRSDVLLVIDVSGSMAEPAPGTRTPIINLVRDGVGRLGELLPDDSELAMWQFGSLLDPPRDYEAVVARGPLDDAQRQRLDTALVQLSAQETGTGLYDTILASYLAARDACREGTPCHVVIFTDGNNEDDANSISAQQLTAQLAAARDPEREVYLTLIAFGPEPDVETLEAVLEPVEPYVDPVATANDVRSVFIHVAAGGVHH